MPMPSLRDLQSQFFASITSGLAGGEPRSFDPALVQVVRGWGQLGPEERLDIYAHMYHARLLDVLHEDFPRVTALVGDKYFHEIAYRYLARYPSTHPSVRYVGRHFSEFLGAEVVMEGLPFLADLAQLEWTRLEVFDAPDAEPLQMVHLQAIPPEEWPALRFRLVPACQILRSAWPVHRVWAAEEETALYEIASPAETVVRVWREGFTVYQASLNTAERLGLDCVLAGEPFAAICVALEPVLPAETVTHEVGGLLMRWIEDGILERLPEY